MSKQQIVDELHTQARRNFMRRRVIIKGLDDLWQADLVEMIEYSKINKGYKYILTIIDTFSKYAWCVPLKTKNSNDVVNGMRSVFAKGRLPRNLQTDNGKEFYNKQFQNLMKQCNINHYSTFTSLKASIVERFNRTLKNMMWKKFSFNGNFKWIHFFDKLVSEYNNKYHRTIKMKPSDVTKTNEADILRDRYNHLKIYGFPKFKVGDSVRISKYKHVFEKGYTPNWTTEIFKIKQVRNTNPATYILEDFEGNVIKGGFYEKELLKTNYPNNYLVEKIIKRTKDKVFVKWLGFPAKYNSWINKDNLL